MRKSLEVLSFMYCIRLTWRNMHTDVGATLFMRGLFDVTVFCVLLSVLFLRLSMYVFLRMIFCQLS